MRLKTILNNCHGFSGFKYISEKLNKKYGQLKICMAPKKSAKAKCSICKDKCPTYDHQKKRIFKFIPMWGYETTIEYQPRRVTCKKHGVVIEWMPWSIGKRNLSNGSFDSLKKSECKTEKKSQITRLQQVPC